MAIKQKMLLGAAVLYLLSGSAAYAQLNVELNVGQPAYVEPAPAYVAPYPTYYDPHHRNHDLGYWRDLHRRDGRHDDHRR